MKRNLQQTLAMLLVLLLILTGCQTGDKKASSNSTAESDGLEPVSGAMGRFVEQAYTLPEDIGYVVGFDQLADGSYLMMANADTGTMLGGWKIYESTDYCETWTELPLPWLAEFSNDRVVSQAMFVSKEEIYVSYQEFSQETDDKMMAFYEAEDDEGAMALNRESERFGKANLETFEQLPYVPAGAETYYYLQDLSPGDENSFWAQYFSEVVRMDKETGQKLGEIESRIEYGTISTIIHENEVFLAGVGKISVYDLESSELLREFPIDSSGGIKEVDSFYARVRSSQLMSMDYKKEELYFLDPTGIYAMDKDGVVVERLVDGSLTSLAMPNLTFLQFYYNQADNSFTFYCAQNEEKRIFRYTYDDSVPTVPSKELTVYSLLENSTIQQAVSMYQLAYPDTRVILETGTTWEDGITTQDALRTLATEMLAGKGPDVLVLDGMPIDSYQEKGILKDLSPLVEGDHGLLSNIIDTMKSEKGIFAIPARFTTYVVMGENLGQLESLSDIAAWYPKEKDEHLGIYSENLPHLYNAYGQNWFHPDGSLNKEELEKTLKELDTLATVGGVSEENDHHSAGDITMGAMLFKYHRAALAISELTSLNDLQYLYSGMKERDTGEINMYPDPAGEKSYYIPSTLLGVNSQSTKTLDAEQFVKYALSKEVLVNDFGDGLPTNVEALKTNSITPYPPGDDGMFLSSSYVSTTEDGEEEMDILELAVSWPEAQWMEAFLGDLKKLNTPVIKNSIVDQIVVEELDKFLTQRTQTAEETGKNIEQALSLYLAEQ